jgi:hypothetical protein
MIGVLLVVGGVERVVLLFRVDLEGVVDPELGDLRPLLGLLLAGGRRRGLLLVRAVYHHGLLRLRAGRKKVYYARKPPSGPGGAKLNPLAQFQFDPTTGGGRQVAHAVCT